VPTVVVLILAASLTIAATGLGVLPIAALGPRRVLLLAAALNGTAAGAMLVASFAGLLEPGLDNGTVAEVVLGVAAGVTFMVLVHRRFHADPDSKDGRWHTVAIGLFAHSLPEGLAIGTAFASGVPGLDAFVVIAIAVQNIPEGTATALPMQEAGHGTRAQILAAVVTSLPQLVGALAAFYLVETAASLLPVSFGFAAGAMLAVTALELIPFALARGHRVQGMGGMLFGGVLMVIAAQAAAL
jgi:ZIP family zinc transporter